MAAMLKGDAKGGIRRDLQREGEAARRLMAKVGECIGADEITRHDTIEGETSLLEALDGALARLGELDTLHEALNAHIQRCKGRMGRLKAQEEAIRSAMLDAMDGCGLDKVERPIATISVAKVPRGLEILNEAEIPVRFWIQKDPVVDRAAIKSALESGEDVPGAALDNGGTCLKVRSA